MSERSGTSKLTDIVWDGDNTLWGWMDYAVPAYESMCRTIAMISGKTEAETAAAMKAFYSKSGTLEDSGLVQGLADAGFFDHMEHFDRGQMVSQAKRVFSRERSDKLKLYEGIEEVLEAIQSVGIKQHLLSDAPMPHARKRTGHFWFDRFFGTRNAMPGRRPPGLAKNLERRFVQGEERVMSVEKPHTNLEAVLGLTREQIAQQVVIIGDNYAKDMGLAKRYGARGLHAAYGLADSDLVRRIQPFAPEQALHRNASIEPFEAVGDDSRIIRVDSPREILQILRGWSA